MTAKSSRQTAMSIERTRPPGMAAIPGGAFTMGSDDFYAEERPARRESVDDFFIDLVPVTNRAFAEFVAATGYRTLAERRGTSAVFIPPGTPVDLRGPPVWWREIAGACWRRPEGAASRIDDRLDHPVVHIAKADAEAYAAWVGKRLPSEAEWERAARGGLEAAVYAWGDTFLLDGRHMANTWQGEFPLQNLALDGLAGTSPVGAFQPGGFGAYDMIGNVWEWTASQAAKAGIHDCCVAPAPAGEAFVLKGGSFLCAANYCRRYRPSARIFQVADETTGHIGFRCAGP